jgi:multimeric flavodoxin WrbA
MRRTRALAAQPRSLLASSRTMPNTKPRLGQAADPAVTREAFRSRYLQRFFDPLYAAEQPAIDRLELLAWQAYQDGRKAPRTAKAGRAYADPDYELSVEWSATAKALKRAQAAWGNSPSRVLLVCASPRNDGSCPGEVSKTWRLTKLAQQVVEHEAKMQADVLDLSLVTSDYERHIHPCKGCVSTAMPLCHWPCSCYPNHATGQVNDWMADIYERWVSAHAVLILTPVHWYSATSPLKLMMDRLVCADGGNPDPTSTDGKSAKKAKALELAGWPYPKHLAGRAYGVVVHGDVAGIEGVRRALCDWLDWMGLIDAGPQSRLDRMIGYYEPYATSHATLDRDTDMHDEVRNAARAVCAAVKLLRSGKLPAPDRGLQRPRPK